MEKKWKKLPLCYSGLEINVLYTVAENKFTVLRESTSTKNFYLNEVLILTGVSTILPPLLFHRA